MMSRVRAALYAAASDWARFRGSRVHPLRLALELAACAWALWPIVVLLGVFASRLTYPMDLEWCEGGILYQAKRLLSGLAQTNGVPQALTLIGQLFLFTRARVDRFDVSHLVTE